MATTSRRISHERLRAFMERNYGDFSLVDPVLPYRDPPVAIWIPRPTDNPNRARISMPTPALMRQSAARVMTYLLANKRFSVALERGTRNSPYQVVSIARGNSEAAISVLREAFGVVAVMQDYTATEICTASCQTAKSSRDDCNCSCLGRRHGGDSHVSWTDGQIYAYHDFKRLCYITKSQERLDYERDKLSGAFDVDDDHSLVLA